ncbi:MAG: glycosyltransferase family 1 protein [Saprospiraceae bacterium]|nr:glycosyltransferase family 1 protein [Saprospiraceae bacterium]
MRKKKIAFFAEILIRDFDGATRTMFEIIDRIDRTKFEFIFFCGVPPKEDIGFEVFHIPTLTIPFNKTYKMASMVGMGPAIAQRLDEYNPDLIHISTPAPLGYFALKYGLKRNIPVTTIYHTHFISYIKYYTHNTPLITSAFEKALIQHNKSFYNRCSKVFVPTETMKEELEERGFATHNMKIWRRGINTQLFNPSNKDEPFIKNLVKNEKTNILFASRLVWEKNLQVLVDIQELINKKQLKYNMIIAGDGVARVELEQLMPEAIFLGHVSHEKLAKLYSSCDYFLFSSITETYGNVVAEAMVSGIPCIVADGGGPKSFIKEGINGFICKPNEAKDYLRKIRLLENHPEFKLRMQKQGIKDMESLTWSNLVEDLFDDFEGIIEESIFKNAKKKKSNSNDLDSSFLFKVSSDLQFSVAS